MIVFADIQMNHMVVNLCAKCIDNTHEACAASFWYAVVEDKSFLSTWCQLRKDYFII